MYYKVVDNFLNKEDFILFKNTIEDPDFPWRYRTCTTPQDKFEKKDKGYFTYNFYENHLSDGKFFDMLIIPFLKKLNAAAVIQARANLILSDLLLDKYTSFHTDYENKNNLTAIFNFTDCDGGTLIKNNGKLDKIQSKQNRLIILNGDVEHASIKPYNVNQRYILNINYFL